MPPDIVTVPSALVVRPVGGAAERHIAVPASRIWTTSRQSIARIDAAVSPWINWATATTACHAEAAESPLPPELRRAG